MSPTDEELMKAYQMGDSEAFEIIYQRNCAKVFAYLKKRLQRREVAEECFQMVFAKFHKLRHRYNSIYSVEQWLYVIAKTTLIDHFRKRAREVQVNSDVSVENVSLGIENAENNAPSLEEPLETLPLQQRQVVEWRTLDELSYQAIAERLGQAEPNIRQLFSRAIRRLKVLLKQEGSNL